MTPGDLRAREAALRSILEKISGSRDSELPIFKAILDHAMQLCQVSAADLFRVNEEARTIDPAACAGPEAYEKLFFSEEIRSLDESESNRVRAVLENRVVQIEDPQKDHRNRDIRTTALVPISSGGEVVALFRLHRNEERPFSDDEIHLVQTFGTQAVIAIENARQSRELHSRLEREAATRDVLAVISKSRDDEKPVFDVILENAARLCKSSMARLHLLEDDGQHRRLAAHWGDDLRTLTIGEKMPMGERHPISLSILEGRVIHIEDIAKSDLYKGGDPLFRRLVEEEGLRTLLTVPLLKDGKGFGCVALSRRECRPFEAEDIELVKTFASQAVIAIENVRQFRQLQTRLEREAATRQILEVISRSRDDEQPVLETIVESAARLCDSPDVGLHLVDEARTHSRLVCVSKGDQGIFEVGQEFALEGPHQTPTCIREGRSIHNPDIKDDPLYRAGDPVRVKLVDEDGVRSRLSVPLLRGGEAFGCINVNRHELRPFTPDEIALIETFAAQAVIAIENVRQFRELQTRLEREAATREILEVISRSQDDDKSVFNVILRDAARLCDAPMARLHIVSEDRTEFRVASFWGDAPRTMTEGDSWPLNPEITLWRTLVEGETLHLEDHAKTENYLRGDPIAVKIVEEEGIRTRLSVPLMHKGVPIGAITLSKREVKPFDDDQIALVETFAAQAVIAIENVRQFRELQTRLEREAATRRILQVISQSRDDEKPVFEAILENAARLCNAPIAFLSLATPDRKQVVIPAHRGTRSEFGSILDGFVEPITRTELVAVRPVVDGLVVREDDIKDDDTYRNGDLRRRQMVDVEGARSVLGVPLIHGGEPVGAIILYRREVQPFTADDVTLIENFAAQAVIAIENVHQFRELQNRLEREAATREILEIISRSRDEDQHVFDAILENAARLCDAPMATLQLVDDTRSHLNFAAHWGDSITAYQEGFSQVPLAGDHIVARTVRGRKAIQVADIADDELYRKRDSVRVNLVEGEGVRTFLAVPLTIGDRGIGTIALYRRQVRPFTPDQIALVETFAAQAVIAIENVRQFREVQTRLDREAGTREILSVISTSRDDEQPVFDAILENACRLCNAPLAYLSMTDDDRTHVISPARRGAFEKFGETLDNLRVPLADSRLALARAINECRVFREDDISDHELYTSGDPNRVSMVEDEGARSLLVVPLVRQGLGIGSITLYRREVAPFSDDDVALVEAFAAQAVIAIESVRQFRELQNRLEREAATREILEVISRSRDDEEPVFDAILENACRLCDTPIGAIVIGHDGGPPQRIVAHRGASQATQELYEAGKYTMDPETSFAAKAIVECRTIHIEDMAETERYLQGDPRFRTIVDGGGIRTNMFVPLISQGRGIGCIFVFRREVRPFTEDQIALVETFAAQAVIAIENVRQFRALEARTEEVQALNASLEARVEEQVGEIERMGRLKRFLPAAVADTVISQGSDKLLGSHRALLGVLFCDMRGFTAFCEIAEPEETIEVLQTYHKEMGRLIAEHGAGVDHRMGDGIMVLFNDPLPCDDPAGDAVRLALAMRERMQVLCKQWKKLGHRLGFGVGISMGYATVGMVGYEGRYEYTASGTAVNVGSRLCERAEDGEILLSQRAATAVEDDYRTEPVGEIDFKGIREPVVVFRLSDGPA